MPRAPPHRVHWRWHRACCSSACSRRNTAWASMAPINAASCSTSSTSCCKWARFSTMPSVRFMSRAIISETVALKLVSSCSFVSSGWWLSAVAPSIGASDTSTSNFCNSVVHMTSCVKSWNLFETKPWNSSICSKMLSVCCGKTLVIFSQRSFGLNSSHFSGRTLGPRKRTKVGVPRATGHPLGKSFFSMFNRLNTIGTPLLLSSTASELTNGRMRKQRKQVSSYIWSSTGIEALAATTSSANELPEVRGTSRARNSAVHSCDRGAKKSNASDTGTSAPTCKTAFRCPLYMTTRIGFLSSPSCAVLGSGNGGSPSFLMLW
mmetsp:Transcript_65525/g.152173  ORF Transcript_65525/g.152173 Transcript_65525/m.152173 type:complete len:320 (+) Transcript_65525:166-1125(+)